MKVLDRYLLRELLVPFAIGTIAVIGMFQINTYMFVAKSYNLEHISLTAILQYILYLTPSFASQTLPVSTALGASLAITRLARESEITAMRAAGARILRIIAPLCAAGLLVGVVNFYVIDRLVPVSMKHANALVIQIGISGGASTITSNKMVQLGQWAASLGTVYKNGEDLDIHDVLLVGRPAPNVTELITADEAVYHNGRFSLRNALYRRLEGLDLIEAKPKDIDINQKIITGDIFNVPESGERTVAELREAIQIGKKAKQDVKALEVEYYKDFAIPGACLIFALVSPVFAMYFAKSGGFVGVLLSIVMVMLYYNAFVVSTDILGKWETMPAWLAAWLPNILFGVIGLIGIRRLE